MLSQNTPPYNHQRYPRLAHRALQKHLSHAAPTSGWPGCRGVWRGASSFAPSVRLGQVLALICLEHPHQAGECHLVLVNGAAADAFFPLCALAAAAWLMQAQVAGCPCPQRRLPVRWAGESWWWLYVLMNCLLPRSSSSGTGTMPFLCVGRCRSCRRSLSHWAPWLNWPTRLHDCRSACEFSSPSIWQPRFESPRCNGNGQNGCLGRYPWARGFICHHHISRCQQPQFPGGMAGPWGHWYCLIWAAPFCNRPTWDTLDCLSE